MNLESIVSHLQNQVKLIWEALKNKASLTEDNTLKGHLYLVGDPIGSLEACSKHYADSIVQTGHIINDSTYEHIINKGAANGYAALDSNSKVLSNEIPFPSSTTLGGVESAASVPHQWVDSISTSGVPHLSQPGTSDISGLSTYVNNIATIDSIVYSVALGGL